MKIDYSKIPLQWVATILQENNARLSRTHSGVSDTSTSAVKRPLLLTGTALVRKVEENEKRVHEYLHSSAPSSSPVSPEEVLSILWTVADLTNAGLLPGGERFRQWPSMIPASESPTGLAVARTKPTELPSAIQNLSEQIFHRWEELDADPVPLASWTEWQLNGGEHHPFYDGCGRISRAVGAFLLIRGQSGIPRYDSPENYYSHGHRGTAAFAEYVRQRVFVSADLVPTSEST